MAIQLSPTGNALATATAAKARLAELRKYFPSGVDYSVPYDTSGFIKLSITQVVQTLVEAVILVFLVMFLFLQNWRYTLIPTLVVPIALLGTFGVMSVFGFSINVLTMFGMVLAIGILVDDAIVVVENVERIMVEEGLPPTGRHPQGDGPDQWRHRRHHRGAGLGVHPHGLLCGLGGQHLPPVLAVDGGLHPVLGLPGSDLDARPLCATLLKPAAEDHHEKKGFFGWFNRAFSSTTHGYESWAARLVKRGGRTLIIYAIIVGAVGWMYVRMPTSFLPDEDQGSLITLVQLPAGATAQRTETVMKQVEDFYLKQSEVKSVVGVIGFSFSGSGQNAGLAFVTLKDHSERKGDAHSAQALAKRAFGALMGVRDAFIYPLVPPPIMELGNATGFAVRVQDRASLGHETLLAARNQLLGMAMQSPILTGLRPEGLEDAPQLQIDIDRDKANALGVDFAVISASLSSSLGSAYINDFPNAGRMQRVIVQADAKDRMQAEDLLAHQRGQQQWPERAACRPLPPPAG
jgi:multidrug efflux pump